MAGFTALVFVVLVFSTVFNFSNAGHINDEGSKFITKIGGVVDCSNRIGREEKIAMDIALQDFHNSTGYNSSLHTIDLSRKSSTAALAAINLIQNQKLRAIVGALTWQEAVFVAEMNYTTNKLPIISLTSEISPIMPNKELPLISMFHDISVHISFISAIVASFKWQKVIALYEETNIYTSSLGIITLLSTSLRNVGAELEDYSAFPAMSSVLQPKIFIQKELDKLKGKQSKVFILLQSSLSLTTLLFEQAKQMGMMEKGYVWIMAGESAQLIDLFSLSMLTSMQGVIGFKDHYLDTSPSFKEFELKFLRRFQAEYPEEMNPRPSLFAVRAYDAIWTISKAAKMLKSRKDSKTLLQHILSSDFEGLSGTIRFKNSKLADVPVFQIFNIFGKSYRKIGFWSQEYGFIEKSVQSSNGKRKNLTVEEVLGEIYWPGGLALPTVSVETNLRDMRIAVLASSKFTHFVKVIHDIDQNITYMGGFSICVFEAAARYLQQPLIYNLVPFYGSHADMIKEVSLNNFDAGIGDILITANRNQLVEFSHPYIESNLVMVVTKTKPNQWRQSWMFLKPFSKGMWLAMTAMTIYTGFVVWFLEHRINSDFRGPPERQIGTSLWFAFSTIMFAHRETIRSQWSRVVLAPWLFLILIITSTYTANLSAMLTNPQLKPSQTDISSLKRTNANVGCDGNSFTIWYLKEVLGFKTYNIQSISTNDEFANSLSNGHIRAAFMLSPHVRVFLSEYCEFTMSGQPFKLSGFGYVFPKGSSLALDISEAIIQLRQSGELQQIEDEKLLNSKCSTSDSDSGNEGLGVGPFVGLFIISGSVSAVALIYAAIRQFQTHWERFAFIQKIWMSKSLWLWLETFFPLNKAKNENELSIEGCNPPSSINNTCQCI